MHRITQHKITHYCKRRYADSLKLAVSVILVTILFGGINSGCRKHNVYEEQHRDTALQLLNTGYYWNAGAQKYHPVYWLDSILHELPVPGTGSGYAYGIDCRESDVYISGSYDSEDRLRLLPMYWKNGRSNVLPFDKFEPFEKCGAKDILVWDDKIYILGAADFRPVLWIIGSNGNVTQTIIESNDGVRSASNLVVDGSSLYVGGDKAYDDPGGLRFEVGYWAITREGRPAWHSIENNLKYATAFSIGISSGKLFIAGERNTLNNNSIDSYMNLWSAAGKVELRPLDEIAAYRLNEVVPIANGNILLNAYDFKTHRPLIFKIDENGVVLENIRPVIPGGVRGYCTSVAYRDGKLAYGGFYTDGNYQRLWFRADNKNFELKLPYPTAATANTAEWIRK
jgi:hypothetical protein